MRNRLPWKRTNCFHGKTGRRMKVALPTQRCTEHASLLDPETVEWFLCLTDSRLCCSHTGTFKLFGKWSWNGKFMQSQHCRTRHRIDREGASQGRGSNTEPTASSNSDQNLEFENVSFKINCAFLLVCHFQWMSVIMPNRKDATSYWIFELTKQYSKRPTQ